MGKAEFFSILRESLEGYIPMEEVEQNIAFYQDYFKQSELSDQELIQELGDPRLIARTIIEAYRASKGPMADYYEQQARSEYSNGNAGERHAADGKSGHGAFSFEKVVFWIVVFLFVLLMLMVAFRVFRFLLFFALPILLIVFLVKILIDFFER
ncbi:MAG: DUF1700 domain-containing protein [Clostridiaceae bacterium]|nr:DUF1700 domain-containing protein [Clostridiaceae bacterium]